MAKRKSLSKKVRFEVFKRDSFKCQYCGSVPPSVVLEIDHIKPVSKGGTNSIDNLLTSCFNCNRGKSDTLITDAPQSIKDKHEILVEKKLQLDEYYKLIRAIERKIQKEIDKVDEIYADWFPGWSLSDKFKQASVKKFVQLLDSITVQDAMHVSCSKIGDRDGAINYFCGICWNKIREI
jgi:hypothetical protein